MRWVTQIASAATGALLAAMPASAAPLNFGDVFAAVGSGMVNQYTNTGTFIQTLNTGLGGFTTGMAIDSSGNLNVTNFSAGNVTRFKPDGTILAPNPFISPGLSPESLAFDATGQLYVGRAGGQFQRYSAGGVLQQTYSTPVNSDWLDLASNQTTMFYNDELGTIRRWDLTTNTALPNFANNNTHGGTRSFALRILPNGHALSAAGELALEYDASGNLVDSYDVAGVDGFFALNLDPDGTSFWTGSFNNGTLYKFDIGGAAPTTTINTGSGNLFGVAVYGEVTAGCGANCTGTETPEPASMTLLGVGLVALAARRRMTRKG